MSLHARLSERLDRYLVQLDTDPQSNPVKSLAYDITRDLETRALSFADIEALVKRLSDRGLLERTRRLRARAGVGEPDPIPTLAKAKAAEGFEAFKTWAEAPDLGIVLTAHPTFSLSRDIRALVGEMASAPEITDAHRERLAALPYLPTRAPTLQEEHADTQDALERMAAALDGVNRTVLDVVRAHFPNRWHTIHPHLCDIYSWVGYDIDGRTDIGWADAIRLRLGEKAAQLARYHARASALNDGAGDAELMDVLARAQLSAQRDVRLFDEDLTQPENLVAAANNLTRKTENRLLNLDGVIAMIDARQTTDEPSMDLALLRAQMVACGLGTSRIHFRLNTRHVLTGVRSAFGISETSADRTLLERASQVTGSVAVKPVNFASLALERSTAHRQMILTSQIVKYIDNATPIRLLIAECEDALTPLGMLYLARLYGIADHLDISPLFETQDALDNGGRIAAKMLADPVYRDYVASRGVFAVQTGFSDAGRFMGQVPATLAIERLQNHLSRAVEASGLEDVRTIIFNTHGEGLGRGGHPGTIRDRVDYVMSPWARGRFACRNLALTHETSFQGGDGFLWFQTPELAGATVRSLIAARHAPVAEAADDPFYTDGGYSWDVFRTVTTEQSSLYDDPTYVELLGGFGQNLLIPTGSRAAKRRAAGDTFNPRQLRAIPHNAILQQFGVPANIVYGLGRAARIDPDRFRDFLDRSHRFSTIMALVRTTVARTDVHNLTAYGRLFDPGFWINRALSGTESELANANQDIASALRGSRWRPQIMELANRLRLDIYDLLRTLGDAEYAQNTSIKLLHALRLAILMKMVTTATRLPVAGEEATSFPNVLGKLVDFDVDRVIEDLTERYPEQARDMSWASELDQPAEIASVEGVRYISDDVTRPLERGRDIARQITIALTHQYDAFG